MIKLNAESIHNSNDTYELWVNPRHIISITEGSKKNSCLIISEYTSEIYVKESLAEIVVLIEEDRFRMS